jgi:hypothetical protein
MWETVGPDVPSIIAERDDPLVDLANGNISAIVLRNVLSLDDCHEIVAKLIARGLLMDPNEPDYQAFEDVAIPEGHFAPKGSDTQQAWKEDRQEESKKLRIDIGSSLGYRGNDMPAFFEHAKETHELFESLWNQSLNPINTIYDSLTALASDRKVKTAEEPDGRRYGPAIVRAHYGGYSYKPHFDSVRKREGRTDYSVHRFENQFAGVLMLQNGRIEAEGAHGRIYDCFWKPEIQPYLANGTFEDYVRDHEIDSTEVELSVGDLYFFNTGCIHEVPAIEGETGRIVLATFIGFSESDDEIFVWS